MQDADQLLGAVGPDNAALMAARAWAAPRPLIEALTAPTGPASVAVPVVANHARWVVECPDCHGAQLASPSDRRFMCDTCGNASVGGKWRPVTWPTDQDAIAAILADRPAENQNWQPGESIKALRAENGQHMRGA